MTASPVDGEPTTGRRQTATIAEATVVLGGTVGVYLLLWITALVMGRDRSLHFTDARLVKSILFQAIVSICLLPWLLRRGWNPREIAGSPTPRDILIGGGLWLGTMIFAFTFILAETVIVPGVRTAVQTNPFAGQLSIGVVIVVAVVNAVFEEFLWLVYAIPTLTNRLDVKTAALISGMLRLSVHAYQGIYAVIGVLPIAIVFTIFYAQTRRVWPVIVAHIVIDAISLSRLVH